MLKKDLEEARKLLGQVDIVEEYFHAMEDLSEKLEKQELIVSVMGQFKRGKSSFINALLQEEVLPTGIVPVTSVVTRIQYGSGYGEIFFHDGRQEKVDFEALGDFVSEQKNPKNQKGVSSVSLFLPHDFLKNGLVLVDTPGVGSTHLHNTQEVYNFMDKSDAIIFVLSVDSPINEIEKDLLLAAKPYASKFYFLVNKIDMVSQEELGEYKEYCESILSQIMGEKSLELEAISSKEKTGVRDFFSNILQDLEKSGDKILEESIKIKGREILAQALGHMDLYLKALNMPMLELEEKRSDLEDRLKEVDTIVKEASFSMDWSMEELLFSLRASIDKKADRITGDIWDRLKEVYEERKEKRPRALEGDLLQVIENELKPSLQECQEENLRKLEEVYEEMVASSHRNLWNMRVYVQGLLWELFQVDYHYEEISHTLSEKEDYYVLLDYKPYKFLPDTKDLLYFLPRSYANKKIYENIREKTKESVLSNANNMFYNYKYKLRESRRGLDSLLVSESKDLKEDIEGLLDQVIKEKEGANLAIEDKKKQIERVALGLDGVRKRL